MTRYDEKIARIRAGQYRKGDFMIADAKDADMGSGARGLGPKRDKDGNITGYRTRPEFLAEIAAIVKQDIVDIMLVSASNLEVLHEQGVFDGSPVKPAIRANEATDCWGGIRGASYTKQPSRAFRTAIPSRVARGCWGGEAAMDLHLTDLGLYSVTYVNDLAIDLESQDAYAAFREESARCGFTHFLEVFNPNVDTGIAKEDIPFFVNDNILRTLAGTLKAERPQFLKIPFNGPDAIEELASFDPSLIVGVLGGGAGTTRDTFELVAQAERFGARIALFGRKINLAEDPLSIVKFMRHVADGEVKPAAAVEAYHGVLREKGIKPMRPLEDDLKVTEAPLQHAA